MTDYVAILTDEGAAALLAAQSGSPVAISFLAVGDANGVPYTPTAGQTALVHEMQRVGVEFAGPDPSAPDQLLISGLIPVDEGGYTVREVGVFTADGRLFAVANYPDTYKPDAETEGGGVELLIRLALAVAGTPNVTVSISGATYATQDWARTIGQFFAVKSATVAAPPGSPAVGDQYLIPTGATGAWSGHAGKVAVWRAGTAAWLIIPVPEGSTAVIASTGVQMRRTTTGWVRADSLARRFYR